MRAVVPVVVCLLTLAACHREPAPEAGGPLAQFGGRFHIFEADVADSSSDAVQDLLPRPRWFERTRRLFAGESIGRVTVAPALGGDLTEWNVTFTNPPHEIRMLVGARRTDGTHPVWRFEQEPAPRFRHDGTARIEGNALLAEFRSSDPANASSILRERWTRRDQGLEFALEAGVEGAAVKRVGGFTARSE